MNPVRIIDALSHGRWCCKAAVVESQKDLYIGNKRARRLLAKVYQSRAGHYSTSHFSERRSSLLAHVVGISVPDPAFSHHWVGARPLPEARRAISTRPPGPMWRRMPATWRNCSHAKSEFSVILATGGPCRSPSVPIIFFDQLTVVLRVCRVHIDASMTRSSGEAPFQQVIVSTYRGPNLTGLFRHGGAPDILSSALLRVSSSKIVSSNLPRPELTIWHLQHLCHKFPEESRTRNTVHDDSHDFAAELGDFTEARRCYNLTFSGCSRCGRCDQIWHF